MFAAIFTRASRKHPRDFASADALIGALFPFAQPDVSGSWSDERALIAQGVVHNTPESLHESAPEACSETGRVIASWVRLDNRAELCAALGLDLRPELTDPQLILAAHRRWGRDCTNRLDGDFSFVIYDPQSGEVFCGRDALGTKPFYYLLDDEIFVAATSIAAIKAISGISLTPSLRWAALFAAGMPYAYDQGAYEEVRKLPPAHDMVVAREGEAGLREYFAFDLDAPHAVKRDRRWVDSYREAFDRAVEVRARSAFLVGADSSGGLDSASIVATVIDRLPHSRDDFHTFALQTNEREPELVEAVDETVGVRHTHRLVTPVMLRLDESFDRVLRVMGHPSEHGQLLMYPEFFTQCEELGIRTMLSGFGGDEVVTSYANHLIDEFHHRRAYGAMFDEMEGPLWRRAGRLAKALWRGPTDPDVRARALMSRKLKSASISREFVEDSGLARDLEEWFTPRREPFTLNSFAALEPGFRYARAGRLESSALYASSHGIEYRFPMFDRRLMQQYFATPSIEKRRRTMGRYLHRRAMEGRIPPRIQWQQSKDVGGFIDGTPASETPPEMPFDDLPAPLREIYDPVPFERAVNAQRQAATDPSVMDLPRAFYVWQARQLSAWLDN